VSPVKYELGFYIPEDGILHSHRREDLKSYIVLTGWTLYRRCNVSPVRYELGVCIPEDNVLHSDRRENFKSYDDLPFWCFVTVNDISIDRDVRAINRISLSNRVNGNRLTPYAVTLNTIWCSVPLTLLFQLSYVVQWFM
jgi:hypothetical protein